MGEVGDMLAVGAALTVGGMVFAGLGVLQLVQARRASRSMTRTSGVVVDLRLVLSGHHSGSSWVYQPVVRFTTADGRVVDFQSSFGSRPSLYRRGQHVPVAYDPREPGKARLDTTAARGLLPAAFIVIGVGLALFGMTGLAVFGLLGGLVEARP